MGGGRKPHIKADGLKQKKFLVKTTLTSLELNKAKPFVHGSKGTPHLPSSHDKYLLWVRQNANEYYFFLLEAPMQSKKKNLN